MPDDLASLFSLIFFLRDVFGFIIILPRDWISEKISACIRHIKRITQRSRLLPDLKKTVLQLWKWIPLYSSNEALRARFLSSEHAACSWLKWWRATPRCVCSSLKEAFWFAAKSSPTKHRTTHGNSMRRQPRPLFAACLTRSVCLPIWGSFLLLFIWCALPWYARVAMSQLSSTCISLESISHFAPGMYS